MNTKPILFSGPMIRALLEGRKTQTRRPVKPQPIYGDALGAFPCWQFQHKGERWIYPNAREEILTFCPYGQPGDLLWVREKIQPIFAEGFEHGSYPAPNWETGFGFAPRYVASDGATEWIDGDDNITSRCKPSIHMPRWASRLTLEITDVRVQRLQDISEEDALAEGAEKATPTTDGYVVDSHGTYLAGFEALWDSINGPLSFSRENPWVWALTFKVHQVNVDEFIRRQA